MSRRRRKGGAFNMYSSNYTLGWSVVGRTSFESGERQVQRGVWRRVNDAMGNHIGYQPIATTEMRGDADLPSIRTAASITLTEMEANAGQAFCKGQSRTLGLPERLRDERAAAGRQPEDLLERTRRKIEVFARVGARKGDILRVWPRNAAEPLPAQG